MSASAPRASRVLPRPNARQLFERLRVTAGGRPTLALLAFTALAILLGLAGGYVFAGAPLVVAGGLLAALALFAVINDPRVGLYAALLVIALLPFAVVPLSLGGFSLTFLELALGLTMALWLLRAVLAPEGRLLVTPVGLLVIVFVGITAIAYANGLAYGFALADFRQYLKGTLAVLVFFSVLNCLRDERDARVFVLLLVAAGTVAAGVGIYIYLLPYDQALAALNGLGPLGYPTGTGLLRFHVESERLRAVGTSIDPNAFGALLMLVVTLAVGQLIAPRPLVGRRWFHLPVPLLAVALLFTLSRSSWVGAAAGIAFVLVARFLWLLPVFAVAAAGAGAVFLFGLESYFTGLPVVGQYVGHLFTGLRAEDQATLMRFGEYKDALRLISLYPLLGVGYGGSPVVDLYVGVSSLYLLLAENAGLAGLGAFLLAVGATFAYAGRAAWRKRQDPVAWLGITCLAALVAALAAGIFDQPFINARFAHLMALFWMVAGLAVWSALRLRAVAAAAPDGAEER